MKFSKITRLLKEYYFFTRIYGFRTSFYHNWQLRKMTELSKKHLCLFNVSVGIRAKSSQSCPPLCNPMDCSPRGSSVHGILQTTMLEWVTMPSSREFSWPRNGTPSPTLHVDSLPLSHQGSPYEWLGITLHCFSVSPRLMKAPGTEHKSVKINT